MEPLFAVKSTYNEEFFYSQAAASRPIKPLMKKKWYQRYGTTIRELLALLVLFGVFCLLFSRSPFEERISRALMSAVAVWAVLKYMNRTRKKDAKAEDDGGEAELRSQARSLLVNSGLAGKTVTIRFYEDEFEVENSGSLTCYRYEGIAWIKETAKYIVIFWNQSFAVPVEKAGCYRGRIGQLPAFLEKRCQKKIEKVRSYEDV